MVICTLNIPTMFILSMESLIQFNWKILYVYIYENTLGSQEVQLSNNIVDSKRCRILQVLKNIIIIFHLYIFSDTHGILYPGLAASSGTNTAAIRLYSEQALKQANLKVYLIINKLEMGEK